MVLPPLNFIYVHLLKEVSGGKVTTTWEGWGRMDCMLTRIKKRYARYWQMYLFLLIPVIYILVFQYYPMLGLQIAFKKFNFRGGVWGSPWVGFYHFEKFFKSYQFSRILTNTLALSFYSVIVGFPIPILFALTLNVINNRRYKKVIQTITYMPYFISVVVLVGMMMQIFHPINGVYGIVVHALTGQYPTDLMGSAKAFPHMYVWSGVWQHFGYNSIVYIAALTGVSHELHEAAQIDGASRLQRVWHIDVPAILPTMTVMLILRMGSVMSLGFQKIYLMQNDLNIAASEVITTYVYKKGLASGTSNDYSYATAINMFNSVVNLLLLTTVNQIARRMGETSLW